MSSSNGKKSGNTAVATDAGSVVVLDENVEMAHADDLRKRLQALMESTDNMIMDGSQVKVIDTAILQLLVAVFCHAKSQGKKISWQEPSQALCRNIALLGLEGHLFLASS